MGAVVSITDAIKAKEAAIPQWFRVEMVRLSGLQFVPSTVLTHWEAVKGIAADEAALAPMVSQAVGRLCAGTKFPSPWQLVTLAEQARVLPESEDRTRELPAPVLLGALPTGTPIYAKREWNYYCDGCLDTGWLSMWCGRAAKPWQTPEGCVRSIEHGAHEWVKACPCAATNPDIIRRKERQRQQVRSSERE